MPPQTVVRPIAVRIDELDRWCLMPARALWICPQRPNFFRVPLSQPHPGAAAVLVDELDPGEL